MGLFPVSVMLFLKANRSAYNIKHGSEALTNHHLLAIAVNVGSVGWVGKAGLTLTDCSVSHSYSGGKLPPSEEIYLETSLQK